MRTGRCVLITSLLACVGTCAQQQTGSRAGVPVPAAPEPPTSSNAGQDHVASLHFRIRVVDGRNGVAIRNAHLKLWYDEPAGAGFDLATDARGEANMPAPAGQPVRVLLSLIDYTDCRHRMRDDPPQAYGIAIISTTGIVADNSCGQVSVHAARGELILFARPRRWYEGLNRSDGN